MTIQELSDKMRKERARCDRYCGTWNSEDRDCEIYGGHHPSPSKCRYFLETELARRNKEIEKCKTAYIKGIRTMANALKDYDRTDGAWTDYFEHTVEEVLKRLLKEE